MFCETEAALGALIKIRGRTWREAVETGIERPMLIPPPTFIDTGHTMPIYNSEADKEVDNNNNKPGVPTFQMKMDIRHSGDKDLQALISHTKAISESSITTKTKTTPSFMDMYKDSTIGTSEDISGDSASDVTTSTPSGGNGNNDDKPPPPLDEEDLAGQEKTEPSLTDSKLGPCSCFDASAIKKEPIEDLPDHRGDELAKEDMEHLIALGKVEGGPNPVDPNMIKLLEMTKIEK